MTTTNWDQFWIDTNAKLAAAYAEQEATMRACMSNRDNYDLEAVRAVVAYHEKNIGINSHGAKVARAILAERLAELTGLEIITVLATLRTLHPAIKFGTQELGDYSQFAAEGQTPPAELITFFSVEDGVDLVCPYSDAVGDDVDCAIYGLSEHAANLIRQHNKIKF